jgi:sialic acid synthase SpsE
MEKIIKIGNFNVGGPKTFIIAEIGSNYNQSLDLAYETIDAAKEAGADAVKFQSLKLEELYFQPSTEIKELHKKIDMVEEWHKPLKDYCDKKGIIFFSSPTYFKAVDILEKLNVSLYKLASAQIGTFPQIIEKVAATGKPTILSTGIVSYSELEKVVNIFKSQNNDQFIILHCNSMYPTPYDKVNLGLMDVYKSMFGNPVGFSDHTDDIFVPIGAVARGAKVIEKHFTLDRDLPVPDAWYSIEPDMFKKMVDGIRAIEMAVGNDPRTEIQPEENNFKQKILYRLVLKKDKKKGEKFSQEDFLFLRNKDGVDCRQMDFVINNCIPKSNLSANSLLNLKDLETI